MPERFGLWLYGVMDGSVPGPPLCVGVDAAHRVVLVRHARLAALASAVSMDEYSEQGLRAALEDLDRLEVLVRAHEHVLDEALQLGAVVPFPICTIYADAERVRDVLEHQYAAMTAALARLSGMAEWGVKAYRIHEDAVQAPPPASGHEYLTRKRAQRSAGDDLSATVEAVHARLREVAAAAVVSPPQDRRLSGHEGEMLLNAAYLVSDGEFPGFGSTVEELARRYRAAGLELELTGPWPPYHFAEAATR